MKKMFLVLFVIAAFFASQASAALTSAWIADAGGTPRNMVYGVVSSSYLDGGVTNPEIQLNITNTTDLNGYYGTFVYRINGIAANLTLPAGKGNNNFGDPLVGDSAGGANTSLNLRFDSGYSVYPGRVWALATNNAPTENDILTSGNTAAHPLYQSIFIPASKGWLIGSYVINNSQISDWNGVYNQVDGSATIKITAFGGGAVFSARPLIKGVCEEETGTVCNSSVIALPATANSLLTGMTGAAQMALNVPINKHLIVNGLNYPLCIGPDLTATVITAAFPAGGKIYAVNASAGPVTQAVSELGQPFSGLDSFTVTWQIRNIGNVNTSKPFKVTFYKIAVNPANQINEVTITKNLTPGETNGSSFSTLAYSTSNTYIMVVDSAGDIGECNEGDQASTTVAAKLGYGLYFYNATGAPITVLQYTGMPLNLYVYANDSNGNPVRGNLTRIVQENGIELFAPVQQGMKPYSLAEVTTNSTGWANMTLIPTGNQYYDKWNFGSYTNLMTYLQSDYSLYGELYVEGVRKARIEIPVTSRTPQDPTGAQLHSLNPPFKTLVEFVYDAALGVMKTVRNWMEITNVP